MFDNNFKFYLCLATLKLSPIYIMYIAQFYIYVCVWESPVEVNKLSQAFFIPISGAARLATARNVNRKIRAQT